MDISPNQNTRIDDSSGDYSQLLREAFNPENLKQCELSQEKTYLIERPKGRKLGKETNEKNHINLVRVKSRRE